MFPCGLFHYVVSISSSMRCSIYISTLEVCNFCLLFVFVTEKSCFEHQADLDDMRTNSPAKQPTSCNVANGQSGKCCSRNGICSHEVLKDGAPSSDSKIVKKVFYNSTIEANWAI